MKLPRVSVKSVLVAVVVMALYCSALRAMENRPLPLIEPMLVSLVWLALPMTNALVVGFVIMLGKRGRSRWFWVGFEVFGGLVLLVNLAWLRQWPETSDRILSSIQRLLFDRFERGHSEPEVLAVWLLLIPALWFLPQFLVALAGGWLAWKLGKPVDKGDLVPQSRSLLASLLLLMALLALPAVAIEWRLRRTVDPQLTRFPEGSEAIVFTKTGSGLFAIELDGGPDPGTGIPFDPSNPSGGSLATVTQGTRVRIDGDKSPYSIGWRVEGNTTIHVEMRPVAATFLDGDYRGRTAKIPHNWLQASAPAGVGKTPERSTDRQVSP